MVLLSVVVLFWFLWKSILSLPVFVRPRHLMPDGLVDTQDGFYGYNSTFTMGLLDSVYFDEIYVVPVKEPPIDWVVGDIVTGQDSDATGVVEASSTNKRLVLSDVKGEFLENELLFRVPRSPVLSVRVRSLASSSPTRVLHTT